ncbi:MAG: hypothetical protein DI585_03660 [Pseudomonas fluorescens]|nr:MAG: hypothetical protein DI585_03660 [Pseudomonas fluorescens]
MQPHHTSWTPAELTAWAKAIHAGEVCAAPAEGVYGYVADPFNPTALQNLLELKQRDPAKGFILLVQSPAELSRLCPPLTPREEASLEVCWQSFQPPITLILPALPSLPELLTQPATPTTHYAARTIAVRCPHPHYMQAYLKAAGQPLVSTSLNISGEPAAIHDSQIPDSVLALTLPNTLSGVPSRIFNPHTNQWLR